MAKLSISLIKDLKPDGKNRVIWDDSVKGFGLRVCKDSLSYVIK